jgi:hypothetical protein
VLVEVRLTLCFLGCLAALVAMQLTVPAVVPQFCTRTPCSVAVVAAMMQSLQVETRYTMAVAVEVLLQSPPRGEVILRSGIQ